MGTAQVRQQFHRGKRIGPLTIWTGWRGSRHFEVEDLRRYGGNAVQITIALRPRVHSDLNVLLYVRLGR